MIDRDLLWRKILVAAIIGSMGNLRYEILQSNSTCLKSVAKDVDIDEIDANLANVCTEMFRVMAKAGGVGLAATQIGYMKRFFVFSSELIEDEVIRYGLTDESSLASEKIAVIINPIILNKKGIVYHEEGCLSISGLPMHVPRHKSVSIKCNNIRGETLEFVAENLFGYLIQHETDHLNGILILDKLDKHARHVLASNT